MSKVTKKKISELQPDESNINKGSEYGDYLLGKSLQEVGAGRSVLIDRKGKIIAGNKTVEKAVELGFEEVIIVPTDGKTLVAVQRTDIDIDSPVGAKIKILDNTVSRHNYVEDAEVAEAVCQEYNIDGEGLGLDEPQNDGSPKQVKKVQIKPYEMTHILISFHPDKLIHIQHLIEQIAKVDGVEIEQSSN